MDKFETHLRKALREPEAPAHLAGRVSALAITLSRTRECLPTSVAPARHRWLFALAAVLALCVASAVIFETTILGPHAVLDGAEGSLYRVRAGQSSGLIRIGAKIRTGEPVRSEGRASVSLSDGSHVEMRSHAEIALQAADDGVLLQLNEGTVIVTAAKQGKGHLYVRTKHVTVSVIGTVFLVNAEEEGSHVAVIQGEVQTEQANRSEKLHRGEQLTTNPAMRTAPIPEELAWSQNAATYLALLQQSGAAAPAAPSAPKAPLRFEAVSIKLPVYPRTARFGCRGADGTVDLRGFGSAFADTGFRNQVLEGPLQVPRGRCVGQPDLRTLIGIAYGIPVIPVGYVTGGPDWLNVPPGSGKVQRFSIEAKAEDDSGVTKDQLRQMLQSMLSDRFSLKVHWDTGEAPGYALVVAKNGPKLKETWDEEVFAHPVIGASSSIEDTVFAGKSTLQALADALAFFLNAPTVDKTNLGGIYEYTLKLHMNPGGAGQRGGAAFVGDAYDPPISTALQEQLGLRLEPQKVQVRRLVIDHLERPTEN